MFSTALQSELRWLTLPSFEEKELQAHVGRARNEPSIVHNTLFTASASGMLIKTEAAILDVMNVDSYNQLAESSAIEVSSRFVACLCYVHYSAP